MRPHSLPCNERAHEFQQLRSVRETVKELEDELGIELFERTGRRLLGLTPPGAAVLPIIERLLQEAENLKRAGDDFAQSDRGLLTVAATHTQARYAMPGAIRDFRAAHPQVRLHLQQGSPRQVSVWASA
jgi:LysR family transcriptional regulator, cys regulon transcriptional activator